MLRFQDLLSWFLHDRLCILFPRRADKYIITLQVRMLVCMKDWTSSRNSFCMQKELKTLRGQDLFGKNAADLCLVPNVKIPHKFKVPDFEKYKGNSCPQSHLLMYARRMSTQTNNQQLLIHYFQDNLSGAALKWYMNLDSSEIRTFRDLGEAFVKQYKYNLDMAPDRDQLRAMTQKDRESFKEYAQRWREVAAQICPPLEEKEMTKI